MRQVEVVNKDRLLSWRWAPLSDMVRRSPLLTDAAKILYNEIVSFVWQKDAVKAWPGQQRLADNLGKSTRTIKRLIKELVGFQLIAIRRRPSPKTSEYFLLEPDADRLGVVSDGKGSYIAQQGDTHDIAK